MEQPPPPPPPQLTTTASTVENTNYDNVGAALIRALHETGTTSIEQLRLPLEESKFRRDGLLSSSRLSSQHHRSSLPSVTVTCSDGDGSKTPPTSGDHLLLSSQNHHHPSNNNFNIISARRLSHFNFGLRRFSNSNSVRWSLSYVYSSGLAWLGCFLDHLLVYSMYNKWGAAVCTAIASIRYTQNKSSLSVVLCLSVVRCCFELEWIEALLACYYSLTTVITVYLTVFVVVVVGSKNSFLLHGFAALYTS